MRDDRDPSGAFVNANCLRIGPDGHLWIIDAGAPDIGARTVPGDARLIVVDLGSNEIVRIHGLGDATQDSYIDDICFNNSSVYLTDAGAPGLIVLEPATGRVRRVLHNHPSTSDLRTMHADGEVPRDAHGDESRIHADQLEVSPDGQYLHYRTAIRAAVDDRNTLARRSIGAGRHTRGPR